MPRAAGGRRQLRCSYCRLEGGTVAGADRRSATGAFFGPPVAVALIDRSSEPRSRSRAGLIALSGLPRLTRTGFTLAGSASGMTARPQQPDPFWTCFRVASALVSKAALPAGPRWPAALSSPSQKALTIGLPRATCVIEAHSAPTLETNVHAGRPNMVTDRIAYGTKHWDNTVWRVIVMACRRSSPLTRRRSGPGHASGTVIGLPCTNVQEAD